MQDETPGDGTHDGPAVKGSPQKRPPQKSPLRRPLLWIAPIVVVGIVMGLLGALYLGYVLNPKKELSHFPIALVNEDAGGAVPAGQGFLHVDLGKQVADGLVAQVPRDKIDLQPMDRNTADGRMSTAQLYGAVEIPIDFTRKTVGLALSILTDKPIEKPTITIETNPRNGTIGQGITQQIAAQVTGQLNEQVGTQLTAMVRQQMQGRPLPPAAATVLAAPIDFHTVEYNPLPDNTALGLSAFYYALLLTLAGYIGATIINALVDGQLGFLPTEIGPVLLLRRRAALNRMQTLAVKWAVVVLMAMAVSGLYVWIGFLLGMPEPNMLLLWEFGVFVISAVGITSMSVMAIFGNAGMLINLIVFVVLGLPSSGGTVPMEAVSPFYQWLGGFEPMHQIFFGVRSLLYYGASGTAGLMTSVMWTGIGLAIGVVIGLAATWHYDRRGYDRVPVGSALEANRHNRSADSHETAAHETGTHETADVTE